ncbi:MAG TPA: cupin domain-containing protein [Caulobacteraceae bacterium]|nr:cupin domain-containing protein [Caulobacteraceae bacterium]
MLGQTRRALVLAASLVACCGPALAADAKPLAARIAHLDPSKYHVAESAHEGAGTLSMEVLLPAEALSTNFLFLHRGQLNARSSIGQHMHNRTEEMFFILDGQAQFTVNGRTSVLKGPVGVPDRAGNAHALYNPGDTPVQWLNFGVGLAKVNEAVNLGDPHTDAALDKIPQFIYARLDRALLRPVQNRDGGEGEVLYRRAVPPAVFLSNWSYVDHMIITQGARTGPSTLPAMSEVYYVLSGEGSIALNGETAPLKAGDAVAVDVGETKALTGGPDGLELVAFGVARDAATKEALMDQPPR